MAGLNFLRLEDHVIAVGRQVMLCISIAAGPDFDMGTVGVGWLKV